MMNVLALGLVLTTLVTACVWSPTPSSEKQNPREDVIVKEGHRVVVVEFEQDDGYTKVSISPQDKSSEIDGKGYASNVKAKLSDVVEDAKEKLKEASSSLPDVGQGISYLHKEKLEHNGHGYAHHRPSTTELVCDAFGKCKRKIDSAFAKTREVVSEKARDVADKVYEVEEEAKEGVSEAIGKVKDTVKHKIHQASDVAHGAKEKAKDAASWAKDTVEGGAKEAAEKAKHGASKTKEAVEDRAKETAEKAKRGAGDIIDTSKTMKEDVKRNASRIMEETKGQVSKTVEDTEEMVENAAVQVKHDADRIKEKGKKELKEILERGREVLYDVFAYAVSPESLRSYLGIFHLLGLAAAYGMCVWVTFLSSYVLAGALPRQLFAVVQSKLYPVYFKAMAYSVAFALVGHLCSQRKRLSMGSVETVQGFNLLSSLLMILVNFLYLEPRASKVMFERLKWEKEEGRGTHGNASTEPSGGVADSFPDPSGTTTTSSGAATAERPLKIVKLSETLRKLNSYSSFLNVVTLMGLTWHLVHTGQRLHTAC